MRIDSSRLSDDPHRPPGQARQQRGLRLDGHVLLAAEGAAIGYEFDEYAVLGFAKHGCDLAAILEDALALAVEMQTAVGQRHGDRRLGLKEQMLDALRCPGAGDDVRRGSERRVNVAARIARDRQDILSVWD